MSTTAPVPMSDTIAWRLLMTVGLVHALLGVALLAWTDATLTVVVVLVGVELLVSGLLTILVAAGQEQMDARVLRVLLGLVAVVLGLLVVREPLRSVGVVVALLGVFWVLWGCIELFLSMTPAARGARGALAAEGAVAVLAGAVLLAWPEPTVRVVALLAGTFLTVGGVLTCYAAWLLRDLSVDAVRGTS